MSRRTAQKFTAVAPKSPPPAQLGDALDRFFKQASSWMEQMGLAYNRSVEQTIRDRATTASVIPFYDSNGLPNQVYYTVNSYLGEDGKLHQTNKQKSAWALRFSLNTDLFEVLYCAPGIDPIVWTTYLSATSSGLTDLTSTVNIKVLANVDSVTISAGCAVMMDLGSTGVLRWDGTREIVGVARENIASATSGMVQTEGPLKLSDWTSATGSATLSSGIWYGDVATPGKITTTATTTLGKTVQRVGVTLASDTLEIRISQPVLL